METTLEKTASNVWQKSKWLIKGLMIGFLALLLLIPMLYVKELVLEREERQREATTEIRSKWAGSQNIIGPVIGLPYRIVTTDTANRQKSEEHIAYFLPDILEFDATVNPREKHRGIFKVMLYDAEINVKGVFNEIALSKLGIAPENVKWDEAFVTMDIADNRGLNDQLKLNWNDSTIELAPKAGSGSDGMTAQLKSSSAEDFTNIHFNTKIILNGSGQLFFTPTGKSTTVKMKSEWSDPSFTGSMLPQKTEVSSSGFTAEWKSMAHTRKFPQQWSDNRFHLDHDIAGTDYGRDISHVGSPATVADRASSNLSVSGAAFGVDLFIPVNDYQKTLRTIKYALLCILLTFAAFFLIETSNKKSAHPFQYGLIGLALILFYTLLLSISEYTGFNIAYGIASIATIGLIAWFVRGILQSGRATTILSLVLVLVYSYVFSLLQLNDYSLLLGSIGLFLTLGVVMYFSRKLQW